MVELLARLADGRGVNERHERRRIGHQHRVKKRLVPALQIREEQIFLEVGFQDRHLGMDPPDLDIEGVGNWREEAFDAELAPFIRGECAAFVRARIAQGSDSR